MKQRMICLAAAMTIGMSCTVAIAEEFGAEEFGAEETTAEQTKPAKPFFLAALFAPKEPATTAARPAKMAKAAKAARARVKEGVQFARENRPKGRFWCVPFARLVTGMDIRGNARTWWSQAEGRYVRGHKPQIGAVMAFAASRSMPKGHVAVVSEVISDREILLDHANWERNRITTDVRAVDVSEHGDWSVVRVANDAGTLGRTNPVHGFIYN